MNKFTPEEVHDSNQEFFGRKAKPSNKMIFETNHDGAIYHGDVHLRDKKFQTVVQPAGGVISRTVCLSDHRFLPIVRHRGGGLVRHLHNSHVRGGR
jgi:hypothetical protein